MLFRCMLLAGYSFTYKITIMLFFYCAWLYNLLIYNIVRQLCLIFITVSIVYQSPRLYSCPYNVTINILFRFRQQQDLAGMQEQEINLRLGKRTKVSPIRCKPSQFAITGVANFLTQWLPLWPTELKKPDFLTALLGQRWRWERAGYVPLDEG